MTDYGHDLVFGALLETAESDPRQAVGLAQVMEEAGLDVATLSDHPYWPERLDTMMLLADMAARTSRIRLAVNVANLPLRPPVMLARQAATLDRLSNGRFELGLGTGVQQLWSQIEAEGGPVLDAAASVEALVEAVQIIRQMWVPDQEVRFDGRHYRVGGARTAEGAEHPIDIWFGAYGPRMLRLTGRYADAWIPSSPALGPEKLAAANAVIDDAAVRAGRSPEAIRRLYNVEGDFAAAGTGFLQGPPSVWAEQLTELALAEGVSGFLLYRTSSATDLRRFAEEVAHPVREMVAKHRGAAA